MGDTATGSTTTEGLGTPVPSSLDLVTDPDAPAGTVAVYEPDTEAAFPAESLPPGPYPEDHAPVVREANSLRWPARRYRATADTEGPVLGTQPATSLADIALVSTVLEAAKYRKVRPPPAQGACPFRITRADLRSHRRAPWPDRILVLVVDSTCLGGRDWEAALLPFLRWAYVERARISLVQVGGPRAREPMRAEQVDGRNLLNPRLGRALDDLGLPGGTATPLAHGLDLAARPLRGALQHGRAAAREARLVVLSDGRGNVPLAASRAGHLDGTVSREGIDDSLRVARMVRALNLVDTVVLNPRPRVYADLPLILAEALGATTQDIAFSEPAARQP